MLLAALLALPGLAQAERVIPAIESIVCGDPDITAWLGYTSEFTSPVDIPLGLHNFFTPGVPNRGQPTTFQPGVHERVLEVTFNSDSTSALTWFLSAADLAGGEGSTSLRITSDNCITPAPVVDSMSPASVARGRTVDLEILGSNFVAPIVVELTGGGEPLVGTVTDVAADRLVVEVPIPTDAPTGAHDLRVISPDGDTVTSADAFTVLNEPGAVTAMAADPSGVPLFAGTAGAGVFRSDDDGLNWTAHNTGLPDPDPNVADTHITALAAAPDGAAVYAATANDGVFKSVDSGFNWQAINSGLGDLHVSALQVLSVAPATLFAATPSGVYQSTDRGANWESAPPDEWTGDGPFPPTAGSFVVRSLAVDPQAGTLYAGTRSGTVRRYADAALSEAPIAANDDAFTPEGESTRILVLANDFDPEQALDSASVVIRNGPAEGTATVHGDGTITYTPDPGFAGDDTFTYAVRDQAGAESNDATVSVRVLQSDGDGDPGAGADDVDISFGDGGGGSASPWTLLLLCGAVAGRASRSARR